MKLYKFQKEHLILCLYFFLGIYLLVLSPELSYGFSGFESKVKSLNNSLTSTVLPLVSILGLVYAAILAVIGDGAARGRITMVIVASVVGFLAGPIIRWIQSIMGY